MTEIEKQIRNDAKVYQALIEKKFKEFNPSKAAVPVTKDVGDAYLRGYRKYNGAPFVIKLSREAIAYLYVQMFDNTVGQGKPMSGDLAVGFANFTPDELQTPLNPIQSDPNWNQTKAYQNTVMLGYWDKNKGVVPFNSTIPGTGGPIIVEYYDDWNQEWP